MVIRERKGVVEWRKQLRATYIEHILSEKKTHDITRMVHRAKGEFNDE